MFEKLIEGIKNYKDQKFDREAYLTRVRALPKDYQTAYNGIADYMWSSGAGGSGVMDVLVDVLSIFEDGAKDGKDVFGITGDDVIGFADGLLCELPGVTWMNKMKADRNKSIVNAIKKQNGGQ